MTAKVDSHVSGTLSDLDTQIVSAVPPGGNWRDLPEDFPSQRVRQIREGAKNGGGSRSTYYGRLRWDRPAYTVNTFITRPGNGCFIHPRAQRLITAREAARLQTFPDSATFVGPLRARATQIGNAVPPLLAYRLGRLVPPGPVADLFCGAGGMSYGFEMAGHEVVAAADFDKHAVAAARMNAADPGTVEQLDLSEEDSLQGLANRIRQRARGGLSALVGGPPCQGFSTAGPCRVGDPRNRLVQTFLRAVQLTEPAVVMMENVPSLMWRGRGFLDELLEELEALGYTAEFALLHAEAYGVPQLRRRLIVMATRDTPVHWPAPTHAIRDPSFPTHQPTATDGRLPASPHVRHAIGDLPDEVAADADEFVPLDEPSSDLQLWCRGLLSIEELVPSCGVAPAIGEM
jgi:DNA (cytosine-5)-methyltransferase 1